MTPSATEHCQIRWVGGSKKNIEKWLFIVSFPIKDGDFP